jgi:hypothetical protein
MKALDGKPAAAAATNTSRDGSSAHDGPFYAAAAAPLADLDSSQTLEPQLSWKQSMLSAAAAAAAVVNADAAAQRSSQHSVKQVTEIRDGPAAVGTTGVLVGCRTNNSSTHQTSSPAAARESHTLEPAPAGVAAVTAAPTPAPAAAAAATAAAAAAAPHSAGHTGSLGLDGTLSRCHSLPGSSQAANLREMRAAELLQQLGLQQFEAVFEQQMIWSVNLIAKMERQDFVDIGVPKGAALVIMERCRQLLQG